VDSGMNSELQFFPLRKVVCHLSMSSCEGIRWGTLNPVLAVRLREPEVEPRRKGRVVLGGLMTWLAVIRLSLRLLSIIGQLAIGRNRPLR